MVRLFIIILISLFIFFQYSLWLSSNGVLHLMHLKHQIKQQEKVNEKLSVQNRDLVERIQSLKRERDAIEELAREQLDLIKKGETYYQFIE